MLNKNIVLLTALLILVVGSGQAQVGQSPYSFLGLGTINSQTPDRIVGLTGVGLDSIVTAEHPALLARNSFFATFSGGLGVESRRFSTDLAQDRATSGGFNYLSLSFPILQNKIGFSFGARPYSTVSYNLEQTDSVSIKDAVVKKYFTGDGGLAEVYAGAGMYVTNELMVGLKARYLFGNIEENIYSDFSEDGNVSGAYYGRQLIRNNFSDITWSGSVAYRKPVSTKNYITAAFTYDSKSNISSELFKAHGRTVSIGGAIISDTTITANNVDQAYRLPAAYKIGLAYERKYSYAVEARLRLQNWKDFNSRTDGQSSVVLQGGQGYTLDLGGAWMPDYTSVKYYNRIIYTAGIQLSREPFQLNEDQVNEFGINFGTTLPIGYSSIRTLVTIGQRGKTENNLIRERFFRIGLGVNFNDRWFRKRKID